MTKQELAMLSRLLCRYAAEHVYRSHAKTRTLTEQSIEVLIKQVRATAGRMLEKCIWCGKMDVFVNHKCEMTDEAAKRQS